MNTTITSPRWRLGLLLRRHQCAPFVAGHIGAGDLEERHLLALPWQQLLHPHPPPPPGRVITCQAGGQVRGSQRQGLTFSAFTKRSYSCVLDSKMVSVTQQTKLSSLASLGDAAMPHHQAARIPPPAQGKERSSARWQRHGNIGEVLVAKGANALVKAVLGNGASAKAGAGQGCLAALVHRRGSQDDDAFLQKGLHIQKIQSPYQASSWG